MFGAELAARTDLVRQLQKLGPCAQRRVGCNEGALLAELPGQRRRVRSFFDDRRPTRRRGAAGDDGTPEPTPA